jgi:chaperonin cofactor prefoldin
MANHATDYNDPLYRYSLEEIRNMSHEKFGDLLNEHNEYLEKRSMMLEEQKTPEFKTLQEMIDYYEAIPFDKAMNNLDKLFDEYL